MAVSANDRAFQFEDRGSHALIVFRPALNDEWTRVHEYGEMMLQHVRSSSSPRLLLDLGELDMCGSAVVAVMVNLWKEIRSRGGMFSVYCPSRLLRETLAMSRLTDVWDVHENRAAAEQALLRGYTDSEARDRRGIGALALLGLVALAGMATLLVFQPSFGVLPAACAAVGAVSLLLATVLWFDTQWAALLGRSWAVCVGLVALLAVGFAVGYGGIAIWQKAAWAAGLCVAVVLCWFVWAALGQSADAATDQ